MAQESKKSAKAPASRTSAETQDSAAANLKSAISTTADMSEDVLESVKAGQRSAIEAVRKFVDTVDEVIPAIGDRPSRRQTVIDAALEMADRLVVTQYDFLRTVIHDADRSLTKSGAPRG